MMVSFSDLTPQFRDIVSRSSLLDTKRRVRPKSARRITQDVQRDAQAIMNKGFLREAYNILKHIENLSKMLASIRRAYLDVDSGASALLRQSSHALQLKSTDPLWASIKHLTNEDRDQIDHQARIILSKCSERVRELETLSKKHSDLASSDTIFIMRLLPARLKHDSASVAAATLAAHYSNVTYYLSRRLTNVTQAQKEMQEERVRRQMERTRSLGSRAAREAANSSLISTSSDAAQTSPNLARSWFGGAASSIVYTLSASPSAHSQVRTNTASSTPALGSVSPTTGAAHDYDEFNESDDELELSASQVLQFETENAQILLSMQDTLASVQQAEARLLDINTLQMELVTQLTHQVELSDQLYDNAMSTTATVEKGNEQLREAKRRAKDSRLYILVLLIGASLSILFLHYY